MDTAAVWAEVRRLTRFPIPGEWKAFCEAQRLVKRVTEAAEDDYAEALDNLVDTVQDLHEAFESKRRTVIVPTTERDGRWDLIADLAAYVTPADESRWQPLTIESEEGELAYVGLQPWRVQVSFDCRLSLDTLVKQLRHAWPELRARGHVRQTHPLSARTIALIRHVCIAHGALDRLHENPRTIWEERYQAWEKAHPNWHYNDRRALITAFHKAEKALTLGFGLEFWWGVYPPAKTAETEADGTGSGNGEA